MILEVLSHLPAISASFFMSDIGNFQVSTMIGDGMSTNAHFVTNHGAHMKVTHCLA